jgi:hypothetical protein
VVQPHHRYRGTVHDGFTNDRWAFSVKGQITRGHLIQHSAKREQIAPRIQLSCPHLLRGHIRHCSHHGARTGQVFRVHRAGLGVKSRHVARRTAWQTDLRQAEVQNFGMAALGDENIRRFDVAVDDPLRVRGIQGIGNFNP